MTNETHAAGASETAPEQIVSEREVEVRLERSVRYGRIMIAGIVVGAALGVILALVMPVEPGANYELGQIVGLSAVIGAAIGLTLGALLALILAAAAKRHHGEARAVQTDVR